MIKRMAKDNIIIKKPNLKIIKSRAYNFLSNKPSYKIIASEFIKLIKINKINYKNIRICQK